MEWSSKERALSDSAFFAVVVSTAASFQLSFAWIAKAVCTTDKAHM